MSKAKYRSKLELYMSILEQCQNKLIHSEVSRKCNISHYDTTKHLDILVYLQLISKDSLNEKPKDRFCWKLTPEGLMWLVRLREIHEFFIE